MVELRAEESRSEELLPKVRQVVKGNQFCERRYCGSRRRASALSWAIRRRAFRHCRPETGERVTQAAARLASGRGARWVRHSKSDLGGDFIRILREHAAGALAPLIAEIEVGWPSEVLKGGLILVFTDLAVAVASDRHRAVTSDYMRRRARAVILVVDRAGPTDASVTLIRDRSGDRDRLLLSSEDPESNRCAWVIAVSKIDDLTIEEHRQTDHLPRDERPKLKEIFLRLRTEVEERIGRQAALSFAELVA